jgi:AcrR family transcriptional regulator
MRIQGGCHVSQDSPGFNQKFWMSSWYCSILCRISRHEPVKLAAANRKVDRRTLKTRATLLSVFRELVLSRGYVAVTVNDIIRHANIGRSTFYLHFSSKQNLLKYSLDTLCARLAACVDGDVTVERLVALLEHFLEQRHLNRVFFEDPIRSIWVERLASLIRQAMHSHPGLSRGGQRLPRSLVAITIAEMQIAMITHWLRGHRSVAPERIADAIVTNTRALLAPTGVP